MIYLINLEEYKLVGTHWIDLYMNCESECYNAIYFQLQIFQNKLKNSLERKKSYKVFIGYFCIEFIYFMLKG